MKLVPDWKKAWTWFSMQALAFLVIMPTVWMGLPEDLKKKIPNEYMFGVVLLVAAGGAVGRVIDQNKDA